MFTLGWKNIAISGCTGALVQSWPKADTQDKCRSAYFDFITQTPSQPSPGGFISMISQRSR